MEAEIIGCYCSYDNVSIHVTLYMLTNIQPNRVVTLRLNVESFRQVCFSPLLVINISVVKILSVISDCHNNVKTVIIDL